MKKTLTLMFVLIMSVMLFGWGQRQATIFTQAYLYLTEYLQMANDTFIKWVDNAGTGTVDAFKVNTSDEIEVGAPINVGPIQGVTDGGMQLLANVPVSASATIDAEEGWYVSVGSTNILEVKGEALDAGGVDVPEVVVNGTLTVTDTINSTGGLGCYSDAISMDDGTKFDFTAASIGWGHLVAGDNVANAYFTFASDGTVTLEDNLNCTTTEDNDTTFNIFDSGTGIGFNNELGSTVTVLIEVHYITP